ncbi:MAG TPA: DUF3592 domain-containing protein [Rhodocyclaceae bacterium]|nr:DUF3592 domain-containing protein [Rhodocyclaceae bacterium]
MPNTVPRRSLRSRIVDILLRTVVPIVGIGLLACGLVGMVNFAVLPIMESVLSRGWQQTEAQVESLSLRSPTVPIPLQLDLVELQYRYDFDNRSFVGQQFGPHGPLERRSSSQAFVARVETDAVITIWIDPGRPDRAMVHRDLNWHVVALALPALLFCFVGSMMVLIGMMTWNDRPAVLRRRRPE